VALAVEQQPLDRNFFARPVNEVARALIGCTVEHAGATGKIVETEAYHHTEPACHAFVGPTERNAALFGSPGHAYVYLSYGIHSMLNFVTEAIGDGAAVLIRALEPAAGIELMRERRDGVPDDELCSGPGKLAQALAIELDMNGTDLIDGPIRVSAESSDRPRPIVAGPRVGITKAADLPWRYCLSGSRYVSRPRLSA
jgi:DNA-3-methyladenine glycosylase